MIATSVEGKTAGVDVGDRRGDGGSEDGTMGCGTVDSTRVEGTRLTGEVSACANTKLTCVVGATHTSLGQSVRTGPLEVGRLKGKTTYCLRAYVGCGWSRLVLSPTLCA